ncbi:MAG: twin-arginine translocase subunit TatB [Proteobacteria bacterium]|nr:twin-arginine translocase subunit TatB [Pseudomonadota bacterium]
MFGIGMPELLVILGLALIILGPKKLPEIARGLGRAMREFRRATNDIREQFDEETKELRDVTSTIREEVSFEEEGEFGLQGMDEPKGESGRELSEEAAPSPDTSDEVEVTAKKRGGGKGETVPDG